MLFPQDFLIIPKRCPIYLSRHTKTKCLTKIYQKIKMKWLQMHLIEVFSYLLDVVMGLKLSGGFFWGKN